MHGDVGLRYVARAAENHGDSVLGGRHDVGVRGIAHDDTSFGGGLEIDVVDAHARTTDNLESCCSRFDDFACHLRPRSHDHSIVTGDASHELVFGKPELYVDAESAILQNSNASRIDLVGDQNLLLHGFPHSALVGYMNPLREYVTKRDCFHWQHFRIHIVVRYLEFREIAILPVRVISFIP